MEYRASRGITCPQPVKNRERAMLGQVAGKPAAIITFLDGMWLRRPAPGHCGALGAALAKLHRAGADFPGKRANSLSVEGWRPLYDAVAPRCDSVRPGLSAGLAAELAQLETAWPRNLPQGVIHADLFPDNVFFLGDKLSGLICFYFACTVALSYDLAICLNHRCSAPSHCYTV